jgi:hypothetical protein
MICETVQLEKIHFISTGDNYGYKIIRPLTEEQRDSVDNQLRANQLYMHYWTDNLVCTYLNDKNG